MAPDPAPFHAEIAGDAPDGGSAVWLRTADGVRLRAVAWVTPGARGTVILLQGRSEYSEKYGLAAAELASRGYATLTFDWRGQGLSNRHGRDAMLGHVNRFADYQTDLAAVLDLAGTLGLPKPFHLLSHSMGGAIALRALHRGFPARTAVFSAPMWGIAIRPAIRPFAWGLAAASGLARQGHRYAPGTGPVTYMAQAAFEGNTLTRDETMFALMRRQVEKHPELALGGPSMGWLREALFECRALSRLAPPAVPVLTVMGDAERIVDPRPVRRIMARWADGRLLVVPDAEHEVIMERPAIRSAFFDAAAERFSRPG